MGIFNHLFCVDINRGVRNFQDTPGAVLLDVRAPQLYARRHIPGSRNLPFPQLDRVLWMENGTVTAGTHEELLQKVPAYRALAADQEGGKNRA